MRLPVTDREDELSLVRQREELDRWVLRQGIIVVWGPELEGSNVTPRP